MQFIKTFSRKHSGRVKGIGSLTLCDGKMRFRINVQNAMLKEIGLVEGGIGVEIQESLEERKTPYVANILNYPKDCIPTELQASKYVFRIPAKQLSDTEFVFLFEKAVMVNKK